MFSAFTEASLNMKAPIGVETRWFRGKGWCSSRQHNDMLEQAVEWGADYICMIGSDQMHPEDMFERLLKRVDEGYRIISAMIPMRGHVGGQDSAPFKPMAWKRIKGEFVAINPKDGDVQEIDVIGSGTFMFPTEVLDKIQHPWFRDDLYEGTQKHKHPCDSTFVWRVRTEAKEKVFVDTTIKIKHAHVFEIDNTFQERFKDWE
jgi:hypothetical protein